MNLSATDAVLLKALAATQSPVSIADLSRDDVPLVWCNQAFLDLTEYSEHEVIGKNCRFLQGIDTKKSDVKKLRDSVKSATETRVLIKNYTKSGAPFWNDLLLTPIFDDDGNATHIVGFQNDISSDRLAENAEQKIHRLVQLNNEISEEKAHLADLNTAKDDFISVASHQLRTPATITKQYLGMVLDGFAGEVLPRQQALLEKALDSNERQLHLIERLLDLARLESGAVKLSRESVDMCLLAREIADEFYLAAKSAHQTIELDAKEPLVVRGDMTMLKTVLENIVDNAIKYSYENSRCQIAVKKRGNNAVISVTDEGIGMDKNSIKKAFERFARVDNQHIQEIGGSGVGLYWAKKAIDMHGGRIDVESELSKGSTFSVILPLETK